MLGSDEDWIVSASIQDPFVLLGFQSGKMVCYKLNPTTRDLDLLNDIKVSLAKSRWSIR
jgi:hypothetical protein